MPVEIKHRLTGKTIHVHDGSNPGLQSQQEGDRVMPASMISDLVEVLKEWDADRDEAANAIAAALIEYREHLDARSEAAWEAMYDPETVAARQHRERTAHLDAFGRSLK